MSSRNQTNGGNQQEEKSGSWLFPAVVGALLGAGATYLMAKSSETPQCSSRGSNASQRSNSNYKAPPKGCCSICQDDYDTPVTLSCGHILHSVCFEEMKRHGQVRCPICRQVVS